MADPVSMDFLASDVAGMDADFTGLHDVPGLRTMPKSILEDPLAEVLDTTGVSSPLEMGSPRNNVDLFFAGHSNVSTMDTDDTSGSESPPSSHRDLLPCEPTQLFSPRPVPAGFPIVDDKATALLNSQVNDYFVADPDAPLVPPPLDPLSLPISSRLATAPLGSGLPLPVHPRINDNLPLAKLSSSYTPGAAPKPAVPSLLPSPVVKVEPGYDKRVIGAAVLEATKIAANHVTPAQRAAAERKESERQVNKNRMATKVSSPTAFMPHGPSTPLDFSKKRKDMQESSSVSSGSGNGNKREQRLMRNRVSAQLSRERKKQYINSLESQLSDIVASNKQLMLKVDQLMAENVALRLKLKEHGSDVSSFGSAPGSPNIDRLSPLSPHYSTAVDSNPRPPKMARTGKRYAARTTMVAFALVFSFGVFYHMVGLDVTKEGVSLSHLVADNPDVPAPLYRGRVLLSTVADKVNELLSDDTADRSSSPSPQAAAPAANIPSAVANSLMLLTDSPAAKSASASADDSSAGPVPMEITSSPNGKDDDGNGGAVAQVGKALVERKGVKVLNQKHMMAFSKKLQQKMVSQGYQLPDEEALSGFLSDGKTGETPITRIHINSESSDQDAIAVDIYRQNRNSVQQQLLDAMEMYKKMLVQSNATNFDDANLPSSIMFCPSAIHIQPRLFQTKAAGNAVVAATNNGTLVADTEALPPLKAQPGPDPRRMLIWVPSHSLAADWEGMFPDNDNETADSRDVKGTPSGVTELNVRVGAVRPLMEPKVASV